MQIQLALDYLTSSLILKNTSHDERWKHVLQNIVCDNGEISDSHVEYPVQQLAQENLTVKIYIKCL